jgi:hypothetical protein
MLDPKETIDNYEYDDEDYVPPNEELVRASELYKQTNNRDYRGIIIEDEWDNIHGDIIHF